MVQNAKNDAEILKTLPHKHKQPSKGHSNTIILEEFLPYRLTILPSQIAGSLATEYIKRFNISMPEWRVVAVLGRFPGLSALDLRARTGLDKVAVSRAMKRLEIAGRIKRTVSSKDRRFSFLHLSQSGWHLYRQTIPFAKRIGQTLMYDFTPDECATLFSFIDRLGFRRENIDQREMS